MSWTTTVVAVASTLLVLLASAGGLATHAPGRPPTGVGSAAVASDAVPVPGGAEVRPLAASYPIPLTVTLASPRAAELSSFLAAVNDPASPEYRHFLTDPQYVSEFAPPPSATARVIGALRAAGATSLTASPDRLGVTATVPASGVEALFDVDLVQYGSHGSLPLYTVTGPVVLPPELRGVVSAVDGLSNADPGSVAWNLAASTPRPLSASPLGDAGSEFVHDNASHSNWFVGSDYAQAYGATKLFPGNGSVPNATFPVKVAIATLLASSYNETAGQDLPPWDPAVVDAYFNATLPGSWPKPTVTGVPVTIGSLTPPLPGTFGAMNDSTLDEYENSLDLEMAGSLAPGAPLYNFYFSGSLLAATGPVSAVAADFAQGLSEALTYNYSPAHLGVVTGSFGLPDLNNSLWDAELAEAAATGVTVLVASGDQGNAPDTLTGRDDGMWPTWPASATFNTSGAISVGGVSAVLAGSPTSYFNGTSLNLSYDPTVSGVVSETAWYDAPPGTGQAAGTEGGVSTVYSEPYWQFHSAAQPAIVNATIVQGAASLGRAEPDVAFPANDTIATVFANATGTVYFAELEGTSVASPVFAGLLADVVAVESARAPGGWAPLGFLDPELYRIAGYYATNPSAPADPFDDVTTGHNYVFAAGPGWDPTTGWGSLNGPLLLAADENATVRNFAYAGPTPSLPYVPSSGTGFPWTIVLVVVGIGGAGAVAVLLIATRPRPRASTPAPPPFGVSGPASSPFGSAVPGPVYRGATFVCPYCGGMRPAEPVRCPRCGAL